MAAGYPIISPFLTVDNQIVDAAWRTFTPQIRNAGAGNTPAYVTNSGRFCVANSNVRCDIELSGDGGQEGSGAGQLQVSLPVLVPANAMGSYIPLGYAINNVTEYQVFGQIVPNSLWIPLMFWSSATALAAFSGADQDNATRTIRLHFWYETVLRA